MRATRSGAILAIALLSLSLGLGACSKSNKAVSTNNATTTLSGSATTASTTAPVTSGDTTTIDIKDFMFKPGPAHVKVGATITVTNLDGTDHSLTADDGAFDTGVFSSGSKTIVITKPGTYTIHCRIHNFMTGTIVAS